jgi:hypothetical protein
MTQIDQKINDNGGTRSGKDRRKDSMKKYIPDRRSGRDRRDGLDRRTDFGKRREIERRDQLRETG